jgi:gamma-glutamyl-gamma-aminobutyrate hydrolase PuuD
MNKKILIVNDTQDMGRSYTPFFSLFGEVVNRVGEMKLMPKSIGLVVFTGGSDVHPGMYQEDVYEKCYCDPKRDMYEYAVFQMAKMNNIPMFGICRGAQFLCVMDGGKLAQHVTGHQGGHIMETADGKSFMVSSAHHQMMIPRSENPILGWASPKLSQVYLNGKGENAHYITVEPEVVEFPSIRAYGVQYHPEIMQTDSEGSLYCQELVKRLLCRESQYAVTQPMNDPQPSNN